MLDIYCQKGKKNSFNHAMGESEFKFTNNPFKHLKAAKVWTVKGIKENIFIPIKHVNKLLFGICL